MLNECVCVGAEQQVDVPLQVSYNCCFSFVSLRNGAEEKERALGLAAKMGWSQQPTLMRAKAFRGQCACRNMPKAMVKGRNMSENSFSLLTLE